MRLSLIAGVALIAIGAFVLINGGSFTSRRDVIKMGDLKVSAEEQHPIRPWVGGVAILAGVGLLVTGKRRNT